MSYNYRNFKMVKNIKNEGFTIFLSYINVVNTA